MLYELHLLDRDGQVIASEPLEAANDQEACRAGSIILDVCKDVANEYEVWRDDDLVVHDRRKRGAFILRTVIENRQANIIDVVKRLERGFTAAARSRRLSRVTDTLRRQGFL